MQKYTIMQFAKPTEIYMASEVDAALAAKDAEIAALKADPARLDKLPAWQPIETCPPDTLVIFGWSGLSSPEFGRIFNGKPWGWSGADDDAPPTHWMPAPADPGASEEPKP